MHLVVGCLYNVVWRTSIIVTEFSKTRLISWNFQPVYQNCRFYLLEIHTRWCLQNRLKASNYLRHLIVSIYLDLYIYVRNLEFNNCREYCWQMKRCTCSIEWALIADRILQPALIYVSNSRRSLQEEIILLPKKRYHY